MFSLDDRAGNVVTTVTLFIAAAAVLRAARAAVLVFVLSLLFAYLVEPAVAFVQSRSPLCGHLRDVLAGLHPVKLAMNKER